MVTSHGGETSYCAGMEDAKTQFAQRLREAMQQAGYAPKPAVLEREFNLRNPGRPVTLHGVRRWLRGETMPTQEKLVVLAEWLKVPPAALRFGAPVQHRVHESDHLWEALSYRERETLEAFAGLPPSQRAIAREVIMALAKAGKWERQAGQAEDDSTSP